MATFTKIPDSETPVVSVNHLNKIAKINDNVYGGFTEYVFCISSLQQYHITNTPKDIWDAAYTAASTILAIPYQMRMASVRM